MIYLFFNSLLKLMVVLYKVNVCNILICFLYLHLYPTQVGSVVHFFHPSQSLTIFLSTSHFLISSTIISILFIFNLLFSRFPSILISSIFLTILSLILFSICPNHLNLSFLILKSYIMITPITFYLIFKPTLNISF